MMLRELEYNAQRKANRYAGRNEEKLTHMIDLYSHETIRELKRKFGFRFSESLGQNFLTDREAIGNIVAGSGISEDDLVIEIGPGIGSLTAAAADKAKKVISIEIDIGLMPILAFTLRDYDNIVTINEDILKTDLNALISEQRRIEYYDAVRIIGNLPYYITTPILMKLLEERINAESITAMVQKEVAERIASPPGSRIYGALSVAVQYYTEPAIIMEVPREKFIPVPKVDSAVINMKLRDEPPVKLADEELFFRVIKAGFGQRRKTLLNSLHTLGISKADINACLGNLGIDSRRRAETLSIDEFAAIANRFADDRGQ